MVSVRVQCLVAIPSQAQREAVLALLNENSSTSITPVKASVKAAVHSNNLRRRRLVGTINSCSYPLLHGSFH